MRILLLLALGFTPALAQAAVDFKCESTKLGEPVSGWLRFGSTSGRNGHIDIQYWDSYPPLTLIDADLNNGTTEGEKIRFVSEADRHDGTIATIEFSGDALNNDSFQAKLETKYKSPETNRIRTSKYTLRCVRH